MQSIGKAAEISKVGIETIRYYEREGVVPPAPRAANGRRFYDYEAISRLRFVKRCRDLGFSISEVRALLSLSSSEAPSCATALAISTSRLSEVQRKIADLRELEIALEELMKICEEGQQECPMLKTLFAD